mmetsp:Transcript_16275/g.41890  ORF Transcript_16275/g.41890 Transcript_16275/m.41890 type:complete len:215 (-) Transcript_16275:92-736(-)
MSAEEEEVVIEEVDAEAFKGEEDKKGGEAKAPAQLSAFKASQEKAKEHSYYFAHKDKIELGPDCVIREEDPLLLADGTGPKKLETARDVSMEKVIWIDKFSFSDDGAVCKLYVEFPEEIKDAKIDCKFDRFSIEMLVRKPSPGTTYGLRIKEQEGWILEHERNDGFAHEIDPDRCKHRVASNGQRITITLAKKDDKEKWHELRKKDAKSTIPRK